MLGIIYALIASVGQGLGYTLIQKSNREFPSSIAFAIDALFGLILWVPFGLIMGVNFDQIGAVFPIALMSALFAEAYVIYVYDKGELSITSVVFASYPVFTIIFSRLINNEQLTSLMLLASLVTILGVVVTALPKKFTKELAKEKIYILWPLSAAILVGLSDTISKGIINKTDAPTFLFALAFAQVPVALLYLRIQKTKAGKFKNILREVRKYRYAIAGAFLIVSTLIAFWLAYEYTLASIASPLTSTYAVFALIGAHFLLGERLSRKDKVGVFLTIVGVIWLAMLQP